MQRLADAVLPPVCPVTGAELTAHGTLSPTAWADLSLLRGASRCALCGAPVPGAVGPLPAPLASADRHEILCEPCAASGRPWAQGSAAMLYDGTGRALVLALKRGDRVDLAPLLARLMIAAAPEIAARADLVTPVPLHWRRRVARRFNQSAEIARALCRARACGGRYAPRLLSRTRHTPSQGGLDRAERRANLAGAFALGARARERIAGRRVLLIDDVLTTGATLTACTEVLLAGGAREVDILVSALVAQDRPAYLSLDKDDQAPHSEDDNADR